jgi:hypothetical protein
MRTFAQKKHPVCLSSAKTVALRTACFPANDDFCTIRRAQTPVKTKKLPGNRTAFYLISGDTQHGCLPRRSVCLAI